MSHHIADPRCGTVSSLGLHPEFKLSQAIATGRWLHCNLPPVISNTKLSTSTARAAPHQCSKVSCEFHLGKVLLVLN